jgi:hypothetical protein
MVEMDLQKENQLNHDKSRSLTPLWVITAFLTFTEVVLGVAVTKVDGSIQTILTAFVVFFPLFIASCFFYLLWKKPHHLYSPAEYKGQATAKEFIEAITAKKTFDDRKLFSEISNVVKSTVTEQNLIDAISKKLDQNMSDGEKQEIYGLLDNAANRTVDTIKSIAFISIDTRPLMGFNDGKVFEFIYEEYSNLFELLNDIWHLISPKVPAFTYGRLWILRKKSDGNIILERDLGMMKDLLDSSDQLFSKSLDYLSNVKLSDVGIHSGDSLEVVPCNNRQMI